MIEALLVVLTNAVPGRDDDFNDWYTNVHTRDALRFRGSIAQQRFRFSDEQVQDYPDGFVARYLALYEVFDAARFSREHFDSVLTPRMEIENSIDHSRVDDFHYYPLQWRDRAPRSFPNCSVVLEQFEVLPGQEDAFRDWYNDSYLPARFRDPRITTAALLAFDSHGQMMQHQPLHNHVAIWRLNDDSARDLWRSSDALRACPFIDHGRLAVTCWDIQTPRLTEDDVHFPTAEGIAGEEAARKRIRNQGTLITSGQNSLRA